MESEVDYQTGLSGFDLSGKSALVTGASSGLGLSMAAALMDAGAAVTICGRDSRALDDALSELDRRPSAIRGCVADVTDEGDRSRLTTFAGEIDILVNNVGKVLRSPWETMSEDEWNSVMVTNVFSPFRLCQLFVPAMVDRGWGRVINVSSIYGVVAGDARYYGEAGLDTSSYFTSKHALIGLTKYLAAFLGKTGVTVNSLSPGMFPATPANRGFADDALVARLADATPVGRVGDADDLRNAVCYLASPGASFVTGHNLIVDGGWTIW